MVNYPPIYTKKTILSQILPAKIQAYLLLYTSKYKLQIDQANSIYHNKCPHCITIIPVIDQNVCCAYADQ